MTVVCWVFVGWYVLSIVLTPASVGKPRQPVTGGQAALSVIIQLAQATALALIATGVLR